VPLRGPEAGYLISYPVAYLCPGENWDCRYMIKLASDEGDYYPIPPVVPLTTKDP
jgi:hypothetical protein